MRFGKKKDKKVSVCVMTESILQAQKVLTSFEGPDDGCSEDREQEMAYESCDVNLF